MNSNTLHIGWASADITPEQPVVITGQFYARVSEGVMDPVTATALALESADPVPGPAVQTFIVQLAGSGSYLPTVRAVAGGSYVAVPASTPIGPEGGEVLVEWTVDAIKRLFGKENTT